MAEPDRLFAREIPKLSGVKLNGCPFIQAMDYPPNGIIRLVQFGLHQEALYQFETSAKVSLMSF